MFFQEEDPNDPDCPVGDYWVCENGHILHDYMDGFEYPTDFVAHFASESLCREKYKDLLKCTSILDSALRDLLNQIENAKKNSQIDKYLAIQALNIFDDYLKERRED